MDEGVAQGDQSREHLTCNVDEEGREEGIDGALGREGALVLADSVYGSLEKESEYERLKAGSSQRR